MNKAISPHLSQLKTNRDLLLFEFYNDEVLVVGCDSAGGIGPKPLDKIKVNGYILGKFTARAALMEVLAVGAIPVCVVDALGVEPKPTGVEILKGIRSEGKKAGLDPKLAVTGSTEKNIAVEQTGIGVTVIGTCKKESLKIGTAKAGDAVAAVGIPRVAEEVLAAEAEGKISDSADVLKLLKLGFIHEIIPVGSTGVKHELETLSAGANLKFRLEKQQTIDVAKSAGPATVILVALPRDRVIDLEKAVKKPVKVVAALKS